MLGPLTPGITIWLRDGEVLDREPGSHHILGKDLWFGPRSVSALSRIIALLI